MYRRDDERGLALIVVILTTTILALLATTVVAYATNSQSISRHDQDWNGALSAAEAGIDDYIFRLNDNDLYYTYGNPGAPAPNTAPAPPDGNLAFTQYVPVAGGSTKSLYRYDIDRSKLNSSGRLTISSTGRVGKTERTVERDDPAPELPRLPVLHRLRDEGPGRVLRVAVQHVGSADALRAALRGPVRRPPRRERPVRLHR